MEIRKLAEFKKEYIYNQWAPQIIPFRREIEYLDRAFAELSKRPNIPALAWVQDGFLVAYVLYWVYKIGDGLWIEFIEVAPHLRGRGIGRLILDDMVEVSLLEGCGGILRCYADFRAMPFFIQYGFEQMDKDQLYYIPARK
ncbi:MAG: GNAT family N-acetyltransferase [Firmicutes bacterium]|nr:GNAT family N-acetyltransferase [Bacillota bacterium]